ncbi:hypothetical protein C4K40_3966 [Pseudomonas sp. CMR5c]|nr:hypothetical protein C4K40_3966 [Pseudomonas sp. CMR5c]
MQPRLSRVIGGKIKSHSKGRPIAINNWLIKNIYQAKNHQDNSVNTLIFNELIP